MISFEKTIYLIIVTAIMATVLFLINAEEVIGPISISYIVAVGGYLSIDLASMIKQTTLKPPGDFKSMRKYRYILAVFFMCFLFVVASWKEFETAMASFGSGSIIILGFLMGGLQGNKIVTGIKDVNNGSNHHNTGL